MRTDQGQIKAAGNTHIGRVRSTNQDSFLVDSEACLYVVADGMGGHAGGEIASKLCIETLVSYVSEQAIFNEQVSHPESKLHLELGRAINAASAKIYEKALEEPNLKGMGTTATAVKIINNFAYFAHVGDSRLYLVREGFLYQMTYDHSLVSEQVRAGILTREEAELHHLRNVITRSVGYQEEEDVDSGAFALQKGDLLLLCSDGLYGKVHDKEISQLIRKLRLDSLPELIDLANQRGGEDNITVILVEI